MIASVLNRINRRGIVISGWSEMAHKHNDDRLFLVQHAPHNWLFPKMSMLVHHGGAGTVAAGLRAGKSALIVPHIGDQPYWARRLHELGVSPKPLSRHKISEESLTERLTTLINDATMQNRANQLGERIRNETGIQNAVNWIDQFLVKSQ